MTFKQSDESATILFNIHKSKLYNKWLGFGMSKKNQQILIQQLKLTWGLLAKMFTSRTQDYSVDTNTTQLGHQVSCIIVMHQRHSWCDERLV